MASKAKHENLLFLIAVFALLLSGDLLWWQAKQTGDEYEDTAAMIATFRSRDHEQGEADRLDNDLQSVQEDMEKDLQALQDEFQE